MLVARTLLALGFVGAIAMASPAPILAQGVYIGPGGVEVAGRRLAVREGEFAPMGERMSLCVKTHDLELETDLGQLDIVRLGADRVGLAIEFLGEKIEPPAD